MLLSASVVAIAFGLFCLIDKDLVWSLFEHDARLFGKVLKKAPGWQSLMTTQGIVIIMIGALGILVSFR
jgi:hypothetical protein